ncbi:uncharacterized protein E0L32_010326 [Thyridium curvatum]|uniref:Uncharacterized protein n=1 Tax=Thyridium curvatum TaxID=1093900 RepID=A0A507AF01_9PEZI|nr:uncharacterized protein E0L32_010326 [Thyridium curvatum]TPX07995.1 hypothetical protein E0L32_010326 [Thyridium curvatum]
MEVFSGSTVERGMAPQHVPIYIALPSRSFARLDLKQQLGIDDLLVAEIAQSLASAIFRTYLYLSPICAILAVQSAWILRLFAMATLNLVSQSVNTLWNSNAVKQLRRKVVFEFIATILGPGGNMFLLLLFWPGWILLGVSILIARTLFG